MSRHRLLPGILLLAVLLRVGVAFYYGDALPARQDDLSYSTLAWRLAQGQGYSFPQAWYPFTPPDSPTSHWSFLYTAFLAAVYAVVGYQPLVARLAGAVLGGLLLPWLLYRLSRRLLPQEPEVALLAALLGASYAFFILYAARLMTETFFIAALLWSLERALGVADSLQARQHPPAPLVLGLGISLGIATLLRQAILPWVLLLFVWLLWVGLRHRMLTGATRALLGSGVVLACMILPFTIRNYRAYGSFLLLNSNAGYALYSAQHPLHGASFQEFTAMPLPSELLPIERLTEAEWDRELIRRGTQFVVSDPVRYLRLSLSRVPDYFEFWPTFGTSLLHNVGRLLSFTLCLPFMVAGLAMAVRGAWTDWRAFSTTPVALALLFVSFYSLIHILTWAIPRYRLPVDAVALPFAALSLHTLAVRVYRRYLPAPFAGRRSA